MIDWTWIDNLRSEIGEDDFAEVTAVFLAELDGFIERLQAAQSDLADTLRSLNETAVTLGFSDMAGLCSAAIGQDDPDIAPLLDSYRESRNQFLWKLGRPAAA